MVGPLRWANGNGTFKAPQVFHGPNGSECAGVVAADFNADGKQDVALSGWNGPFLSVLFGKGDGTFQPAIAYPAADNEQIFVVDLDGDGKPDIFSATYSYINNGDATFTVVKTGL